MKFTKMQGIGNDYIYLNCLDQIPDHPEELSRIISDRHFGVGSDGLVLICHSQTADFRMRMFNADGSEAEMCGNAARCVGKYLYDRGLTRKTSVLLETGSGIRPLELRIRNGRVVSVQVDMGIPELKPEKIPVLADEDSVLHLPGQVDGWSMNAVCVNMGNPHAVFFIENAETFPVPVIGPKIEHHPLFPEKVNAEFVSVLSPEQLRMRVWERGSGETMACGTGACAALAAAVLTGRCGRSADVTLNGGVLKIHWEENGGHILQEGPAEFVFDGDFILPETDR